MRHRVKGRKLGRETAPRKALIRGLARSLILNEEGRITTTISKAKEVRPFVEKLITLSRTGEDYKRRRALKLLPDKPAVERLFGEIGPRYKERPGGYTRIIRWDKRLGDKAERAIIEFVLDEPTEVSDETPATPAVEESKDAAPTEEVKEETQAQEENTSETDSAASESEEDNKETR